MKIEKIVQWSFLVVFRHLIIKIFSLFFLVNITLGLDFSKCQEYYLKTSKTFSGINAIHIGNGLYLAYSSKQVEDSKLIKSSPLIGLYLFKDEAINRKFDLLNIKKNIKVVAINKNQIIQGKIIKKQTSIKNLAIFSNNMQENSIISDICYQIYGISTNGNRFIDKKYIDFFLSNNDLDSTKYAISAYSYIGIDVDKNLVVSKVNPLIIKNIKIGDKIKSINDNTLKTNDDFFDKVTIVKPNTQIKIKTDNSNFEINTLPLNTPFDIQNTYLEALGIAINKDLIITNNPPNSDFNNGDKILKINKMNIKNINDIDSAIDSTFRDDLNILVLRRNFEFFINIKGFKNIDRMME